ncbi:hypothetical protein ES703_43846 [subsurface metagenome]
MPENEIVVYERGKEVTPVPKRIPPELLQIIMLDDIQVALIKLNKHWEKTEFEGYQDFEILSCKEHVQTLWPLTPWINSFLFNKGPDKAYVNINDKGNWIELEKGESTKCDHSGADRRQGLIFYKCDPGKTATVTVVGKY